MFRLMPRNGFAGVVEQDRQNLGIIDRVKRQRYARATRGIEEEALIGALLQKLA
ncbi:hypothetical protein [Sphingomonas sp. Sph1(2015)]|uniref:hypothetical protein n=1 Tax=Sphingomonas sp. Sph1(2015) TaxID=1628084 RepID=UPI0018E91F64|nr:hypothetical protein [Sphingomonas sp. Sph1(2015)]